MLRRDFSQSIVTLIVTIVCILGIICLQLPQLHELQQRSQTATAAEIRKFTEAESVRLKAMQTLPAFGFDNLVADWAFLGFLQYFGDEAARKKSDYRLSPEYFEIVLKHNPNFLGIYPFLSTSTSLYAGMPDRSIAMMQTALQSLKPNAPLGSYYGWRQLGIDQLLFQGNAAAAQQSFATAAEWARVQGNLNVATLSQQTADLLAKNPDSLYAQIAAWSMVLSTVPDDRTRQTAIQQIEALGGTIVQQSNGSFSIVPPEKDEEERIKDEEERIKDKG
jgi:hypothetical protein